MRRLKILLFWLFFNKNNVSLKELIDFLLKPQVHKIAQRYITKIEKSEFYEISFNTIPNTLFWPLEFPIEGVNQVTAETFDVDDWHYYQKEKTIIEKEEYLLDIGTAEGLFPLSVIDKCKHIVMIEPSSKFYKTLHKTFASFQDKVTIHKTAIGDYDGDVFFEEDSLIGQISTTNSSTDNKTTIRKIDTLIDENQKITYLKADIEGFEQEMLKGAENTIKRNKPRIAITTYHTENDPDEIINLIKSYVPEYKHYVKGIFTEKSKPVMIHFWIE